MANGFIAGDDVKRVTPHGILVQGETYKVLDTNGKYLLFTIDGCTVNALAEGFELVPPALPEVNKPYGWAGENAARLKSNYEEPAKEVCVAFGAGDETVTFTPGAGIDATLAERGKRYGDFKDHAVIAQELQTVMRTSETKDNTGSTMRGWDRLPAVHKQALTVIADKIARILSGDPDYVDNWHDIQGYAKLVEDRIKEA